MSKEFTMKKKSLVSVILLLTLCALLCIATACSINSEKEDTKDQIYSVYKSYVSYAESKGETPLTYEEWLATIKGDTGANGKDGITPKLQINAMTNMWEISYDNGETWTSLNVKATGENGADGTNGTNGTNGKDGITPKLQINTTTNMWEISYDNGETWTSLNVKATGENGADGTNGTNGTNGKDGITPKLQINATTNMWEISYDNGETWTSLNVKATGENGADGTNGTNGTNGKDGITPKLQINATTSMWEISYDNGETWTSLNVKATGKNGADGTNGTNGTNGTDGLSAYELYKKYNPAYSKSEQEWIKDLMSGYLHSISITLDTNGGSINSASIIVPFGTFANIEVPTKNGYDFVAWELNGSVIDVNTYVFFADCHLKAIWKEADKLQVHFNTDGGIVAPTSMIIEYGKNYTLPTPSKEYQTFAGWYYLDTLIPQSGIWEYTHESITLTAKWNKTNIYANLSVDEEYGTIDKTKVIISTGDYYTLPVPTSIKSGESFQGWYYGDKKVTDAEGNSFNKCEWTSSVDLTAAYYTEIRTIYEFMDLQGKDLKGKYIVTQDLDFKGLGVNYINSLQGVFDGGGHTLKNFTLSTGADYKLYSGLFRDLYGSICNIVFENIQCSELYANGLIGTMHTNSKLDNIIFKNSLNNCDLRAVLIGKVAGQNYIGYGDINIKNITIENSGNRANTYGIYTQEATKVADDKNSNLYYYFYSNIYIDGFYLRNINNTKTSAGGVFYEVNGTASESKYDPKRQVRISNLTIDGKIANGIFGETSKLGYLRSDSQLNVEVEKAEIKATTDIVWSGVVLLKDSINVGKTKEWGARQSVRCIDAGAEIGSYDLGEIKSSIILYPDANGIYTYYSSSGTQATFDNATLIDKNLFKSMFGFDETIWNLDNIDIANELYPTIRREQ